VLNESYSFADIPWAAVRELYDQLAWLDEPFNQFAAASTVSNLGKLDTGVDFRDTIQARLNEMDILSGFLADWNEGLGPGLKRMHEAGTMLAALEPLATPAEQSTLAELRRIAGDSRAIFTQAKQLLKADQRRPLKGKLAQFQQKYNQLYYGMHERLVGSQAPWDKIDILRRHPQYQALSRLKSLPFISGAEFNMLAMELQSMTQHRCHEFNAQVLDNFVACPYCRFPEGATNMADLAARLQQMETRLADLLTRWQDQLFRELPGLDERLSLLAPAKQDLINDLQQRGELPDTISDDLLATLQELSSDLQPVELDLTELAQTLLTRGSALSVDDLRTGLEAYLNTKLKGLDAELVRIKIVLPDSETDVKD
jgi:hypothetical protein